MHQSPSVFSTFVSVIAAGNFTSIFGSCKDTGKIRRFSGAGVSMSAEISNPGTEAQTAAIRAAPQNETLHTGDLSEAVNNRSVKLLSFS